MLVNSNKIISNLLVHLYFECPGTIGVRPVLFTTIGLTFLHNPSFIMNLQYHAFSRQGQMSQV